MRAAGCWAGAYSAEHEDQTSRRGLGRAGRAAGRAEQGQGWASAGTHAEGEGAEVRPRPLGQVTIGGTGGLSAPPEAVPGQSRAASSRQRFPRLLPSSAVPCRDFWLCRETCLVAARARGTNTELKRRRRVTTALNWDSGRSAALLGVATAVRDGAQEKLRQRNWLERRLAPSACNASKRQAAERETINKITYN